MVVLDNLRSRGRAANHYPFLTAKERDNETGLDYFGARYYASTQGRFASADNFLNDTWVVDPASWNLYAYARNNPVRYTDPTGEQVYVGGVQGADRDEFLRRANATYGCESCVGVDGDGYLTVDTSGLSDEVLAATQFLTNAITSTARRDLFNVEITNNNPDVAFGDSGTRMGVNVRNADGTTTLTSAINIRLDFADDAAVMGNAEAKASFLDFVFAHEVSHFYPRYQLDPTAAGVRGDVDNPINEIRFALGRPLRSSYQASAFGPLGILRFGNAITWQEGCLQDSSIGVARGSDGLEVSREGTKAIFWVQRVVKSR